MKCVKCPSCRKIIAVGGRGKRVGRTAEGGSFFMCYFFRTWVWSLPCLVSLSVAFFVKDLSKFLHGFLQVVTWICQNWYMDFSKLLYGFVKIDWCIFLSCYMDLSKLILGFIYIKLLHGFVKVVFLFLALCQILQILQRKPSWSLNKISKLIKASALN